MRIVISALVVGLGLLLLAPDAHAAFVSAPVDCDGVGGTVTYEDVVESNAGAGPLFGSPSCVGNVI